MNIGQLTGSVCTRCRSMLVKGDEVIVVTKVQPTSHISRDLSVTRYTSTIDLPYHVRCAP